MMRADSMRQTASMALWVAVEVTATHHTIFKSFAQADRAGGGMRGLVSEACGRKCAYGLQAAKSSGPNIWRISVSPSQPGQCFL